MRLIGLSGTGGTDAGAEPPPNPALAYNPNMFEIEGQSNAAGPGFTVDLPGDLVGPQAGLNVYNPRHSRWETLNPGVNGRGSTGVNANGVAEDGTEGQVGIESRLAKLLRTNYGVDQYVLKYCMSATSLGSDALLLDWNASNDELLAASNANFQLAIDKIGDKRPPRCFVWIQGESDANATYAASYQTNLENFIAAKRTAYGWASMPFIIVRMSDFQTAYGAFVNTIQAAQDAVAAQSNNYIINTDAYPTNGDNIHYSMASVEAIAEDVFDLILTLP